MEIRTADCPLGAKCEELKLEDGKPVLYRCPWYVQVRGINVNTGQETDSWPLLSFEPDSVQSTG